MEFKELAKKRYSCRKFSDREISQDILDHLLDVQRLAPTACNLQSQRIYIVDGKDAEDTILKATRYNFKPPMYLVVCYDRESSWKRSYDAYEGGQMDAVIAACHLDFAIAEAGLGTCWIGEFDPKALQKTMNLPEHHIPMVIFPLGYPKEDTGPSRQHTDRKPLEHTVRD
ncbi:MAG: nitroreductase family protein [Clostridiales bacterium]|jgi:nitroreductase|nr:nitroreductase family protein [Clostridiales bacterium]MCK9350920.1 nitroreductase family protein [Clostridiales bacterium]MDD2572653.1 nitroreductase family protein [Eubacteriales bacterium]MDD3540496.1 nitroreductase family protein [Eubacteriales bacterium]NLG30884.1 nitroreductase [Clostridiaceae bacterium]